MACVGIMFLFPAESSSVVQMDHNLHIPPSICVHLGGFFLVVLGEAAANVCAGGCVGVRVSRSLESVPRSGIAESSGDCVSLVEEVPDCFTATAPSSVLTSKVLHSVTDAGCLGLFFSYGLVVVKLYLTVVWISISLMTKDTEHLVCLLAFCVSFLGEMSILCLFFSLSFYY